MCWCRNSSAPTYLLGSEPDALLQPLVAQAGTPDTAVACLAGGILPVPVQAPGAYGAPYHGDPTHALSKEAAVMGPARLGDSDGASLHDVGYVSQGGYALVDVADSCCTTSASVPIVSALLNVQAGVGGGVPRAACAHEGDSGNSTHASKPQACVVEGQGQEVTCVMEGQGQEATEPEERDPEADVCIVIGSSGSNALTGSGPHEQGADGPCCAPPDPSSQHAQQGNRSSGGSCSAPQARVHLTPSSSKYKDLGTGAATGGQQHVQHCSTSRDTGLTTMAMATHSSKVRVRVRRGDLLLCTHVGVLCVCACERA